MRENSPALSERARAALDTDALKRKAAELRLLAYECALNAGKGHIPPAFSCMDIVVALYYGGELRFRADDPRWDGRDRFLLSKGHACLALYAALADLGFFPAEELLAFAGDGSLLPGHPDPLVPGAEILSGSLGHGLGLGAGIALAEKLAPRGRKTFVLLGDAECQEGSIWEAAMFASHHKLASLVAIVDRNRLGATDFTEDALALEPFAERWRAFGWEAREADGHDFPSLLGALRAPAKSGRPLVVIANTVKGKGVSYMQNSAAWHHALPRGEQIEAGRAELRAAIAEGRA